MSRKTKIFTDWNYKPNLMTPPSFVLYPFWQTNFGTIINFKDKSEFRDVDRFRSIMLNWKSYFEYVDDPTDADQVVLPSDWKYYEREGKVVLGIEFLRQMDALGKRTIVQYNSDDDLPLKFSGIRMQPTIVRTSFNASRKQHNEYTLPGFVGDPLATYGG